MVSFKLSHHSHTEHYALATGEDQYLFIKSVQILDYSFYLNNDLCLSGYFIRLFT